ncbi:MAG: shikimate kinase [Betaproteobacteria bacterium]
MGAGKTTIGRSLAKRLGLRFEDSDRVIEARTGVNIPTVFEIEGEEGFRKREAQVIEELSQTSGLVVATGGGVVLRPENRARMSESGFVVYLNVPPYTLWERTRHDKNRPLLRVENPLLRLKELYLERDPFYREVADLIVDGSRMKSQGILQLLVKEIGERWKP